MTSKQAQELLIQNGQLVADTLRHLADNEIDSDYFAITSTSENGTETDYELVITEYARQAAGTVDELVKALEAKDKRIAELEAREVVLPQRISMEGGAYCTAHARYDEDGDYYYRDEVIESLVAAGIITKVGE